MNSWLTTFGFHLGLSQYNFESPTGSLNALISNIKVELGFHCSDPDAEIFVKNYVSALDNKGHFETM